MTETEWLTATEPMPMLEFLLRDKASDRKLRLFAGACSRVVEKDTKQRITFSVPELAERYADGQVGEDEIEDATAVVSDAAYLQAYEIGDAFSVLEAALDPNPSEAAIYAAMWVKGYLSYDPVTSSRLMPIAFCRDIFGNPLRPVTLDPRWQSETVVAIATGIYEARAFDRMPILADALEEAGCDHADILAHCRGDGPHVRGCWVVDLLLGKS